MFSEEKERIAEVSRFLELDFYKSLEFKEIVELAAQLCDKPVALITLLDGDSNWLKARYGTDIEKMPRETSFCRHAIQQDEVLIIPDAMKDDRFSDNPLVNADPNLRFYAGAPLTLNNGLKLGTLCVFDQKPSTLSPTQIKILSVLARQVTYLMELEMSHIKIKQQIEETEAKNVALMKIAQLQSHQIRQPLTSLMGLVNLIKEGHQVVNEDWLSMFDRATTDFDQTIHDIVAESIADKDIRAIRFNKMVEEIDDYAILLLDDKGKIENWNKGAEKIKGYHSNEIIGKSFSIFYTEEDKKANRPGKIITEAQESGVARDEGWRLRKDGTKFWGSIVITAIHDDNGKVIGFTKVTRDLTAIKEAEDGQRISSELYEQIVERTYKFTRVGGWELDLVSNSLSWTSITREIHEVDEDYTPELSTAINFYKEGQSREKISQAIQLAIEAGNPWDLELQLVTQKGNELLVHCTGKPNYRHGVCTKVYGTIQDIGTTRS